MEDMIKQLFEVVDNKDTDGFLSFLSKNSHFRFSNHPVVYGQDAIRKFISHFFSTIKSLKHKVFQAWVQDDVIICEGEVTYVQHDDEKVTLPFVNIFRMNMDCCVEDYRIYIDANSLK